MARAKRLIDISIPLMDRLIVSDQIANYLQCHVFPRTRLFARTHLGIAWIGDRILQVDDFVNEREREVILLLLRERRSRRMALRKKSCEPGFADKDCWLIALRPCSHEHVRRQLRRRCVVEK